jgi:hypothetical protein
MCIYKCMTSGEKTCHHLGHFHPRRPCHPHLHQWLLHDKQVKWISKKILVNQPTTLYYYQNLELTRAELTQLSYGHPWAHYSGGYQDRHYKKPGDL